ncbi:MAG: phosphoenolpyruvate carboxykinase [Chloroflexi bacterium ADurb.Bin180]|nr:MAG: phosphoenolpyruvate carboxykinase [Chloroflexi bacterium ADurb.Bin180]
MQRVDEPAHVCVSIGDIEYLVTYPAGVRPAYPGRVLESFLGESPLAGDRVYVELVNGPPPDLGTWPIAASLGETWSIRKSGSLRCMSVGRPFDSPPNGLAAVWTGDANRVMVYCSPEYTRLVEGVPTMSFVGGYPVDQVVLMYYLARRGGLLVHAAAMIAEGRALLFPGVSGAGKSTLTRSLSQDGWAELLSDDRVLVREAAGGYLAYGTPWPGDAGVALNHVAPLRAILFPARAAETRITPLDPGQALERLLPVGSLLWHERELLPLQLALVERMLKAVPAFELAWSPQRGVLTDMLEFLHRL